jgi:hypothetical protein
MLRRAVQALGGLQAATADATSCCGARLGLVSSISDIASTLGRSTAECSTSQVASYSTGASSALTYRNNPYKNNPAYIPWTPSKDLIKRKTYQKRMRYLMQTLEQEQTQEQQKLKKFPAFRGGDILELRMVSTGGRGYLRPVWLAYTCVHAPVVCSS